MRKFLIAAVIATVSGSAFAQSTAEPVGLPTVINYLPVMAPTGGPFVPPVPRPNDVGLQGVPLGGGGGGFGGGGGGCLFGMGAGLTTVIGVGIGLAIYSNNRDTTCNNTGGSGNCP